MIDFKDIHTEIRADLESSGFDYKPRNMWANIERNIVPTTWVNNAFCITELSIVQLTDEDVSFYDYMLVPKIEFSLDLVNDNYLKKLPDVMTAMSSLYETMRASKNVGVVSEGWFNCYEINLNDFNSVIYVFDQIRLYLKIS